jgi:tetratricopeptide (TPR) repeat protein
MTNKNDIGTEFDPVIEPSVIDPETKPTASDTAPTPVTTPIPATAPIIVPADVPLTQTIKTSKKEALPWQQRPTTYIALAISILLALIVIFVLPSLIGPPDTPAVIIEPQSTSGNTVQETPFRDAQLAKARRESQDSLSQLLEKQNFLEKKNVLLWGKTSFEAALNKAAEGDLLYRQRHFTEALTSYQDALNQLIALEERIPEELSTNLKKGNKAFADGNAIEAQQYYELALAIDASNTEATSGLERTRTLDNVLVLIHQGTDALEEQELEQAQELFQQALKLDALHPAAVNGDTQAKALIQSRDFNNAMSRGYLALEASQFNNAAKAFRQALALQPGDTTANSGLAQANNASAQRTTRTQLNSAASHEKNEQWHQARDIYIRVQVEDSSLIEARLGKIRSSARADLSDAINKILASPLRLASAGVFKHARQLLKDAEGIQSPGPKHKAQTKQLKQVLNIAITPIAVELRSDNTTKVTLLKVQELGLFSNKQLSLKPGNYVAVGSRTGYRDVRIEFQVSSKGLPAPIEVICREPIS